MSLKDKFSLSNDSLDDFEDPGSFFIKDEKIYFADRKNHKIKIFTLQGNFLSEFGKYGTLPGELYGPSDIFVYNEIYVIDCFNRIQIFNLEGKFLSEHTENYNQIRIFVYSDKVFTLDSTYNINIFSLKLKKLYNFSIYSNKIYSLYPTSIFIYDDKLYVSNSMSEKLSIFNLSGNFLNFINLTPDSHSLYEKEFFIFSDYIIKSSTGGPSLEILSINGDIQESYNLKNDIDSISKIFIYEGDIYILTHDQKLAIFHSDFFNFPVK